MTTANAGATGGNAVVYAYADYAGGKISQIRTASIAGDYSTLSISGKTFTYGLGVSGFTDSGFYYIAIAKP